MGLASTNHSKASMILSGIWKLLPEIYQEISELAQLLNDLLKKDKKFEWTQECQTHLTR